MNRREFVKWLGWGTAAAAVAPTALASCGDPWCGSIAGEAIIPHDELHDYDFSKAKPVVMKYIDYTNFSSFVLSSAIDESVQSAAKELSYRRGVLLREMMETARPEQ